MTAEDLRNNNNIDREDVGTLCSEETLPTMKDSRLSDEEPARPKKQSYWIGSVNKLLIGIAIGFMIGLVLSLRFALAMLVTMCLLLEGRI